MRPFFIIALICFTLKLLAQDGEFERVALCSEACGDDNVCLCACFYEKAQNFRQSEKMDSAVYYLKALKSLEDVCTQYNAQEIINNIYQEHRIWMFRNGAYAIATPLGIPLTRFIYNDVQPFRKGVAIFQEGGKYFFINKEGKVLTPYPGYDGIAPAEGNMYYLVQGEWCSFTLENGVHPPCWARTITGHPDSLRFFFNRSLQYEEGT